MRGQRGTSSRIVVAVAVVSIWIETVVAVGMLAVERLAHLRVGLSVVRGGAAWVGTTLLILLNLIVILKIVTS